MIRSACLLFACALALPAPLAARQVRNAAEAAAEPVRAPVMSGDSCLTGRISFVLIDSKSIFDTTDPDLDSRLGWAYRAANSLHVQTRESLIRRELLFRPGDCYDPFLLSETERLLRGYGFLARVDVFGVPQADGSFHVIVDTNDEWSTRLDLRVGLDNGLSLEGFRASESNLLGTGRSFGFFYLEREVTRDYGVSYWTPQLAGTRWDLGVGVGQSRAGTFVDAEVAYPFIGEVSRWAGRVSFRRDDRFFDYILEDDPALRATHLLTPVRDELFDAALLRRIGRRGNLTLIGAGISLQQMNFPGVLELAPAGDFDHRTVADPESVGNVLEQMVPQSNARISLLIGQRIVHWVERRGLDSMRGEEDVKLGIEGGFALGRSIPSLEPDDKVYVTLDAYGGTEIGNAIVIARGRADTRRDLSAGVGHHDWEDIIGEGELLAYLKPLSLPRHTFFFRAAGASGWNTRTPWQITLGGPRGIRGYDEERFPGGQRVVVSLEDRIYLGWPFRNLIDLGGTVFADAGRIVAGDVPFGIDSGWRASAGFGLRGSFPAGGRTTYRIDFAWPIERGTGFTDFRIRFSVGELLGLSHPGSDLQLLRSRPTSVAGEIFQFRN